MSIRTERLAAVIQKDLGEILQKEYQGDGALLTVTRVRMTPDLSIAKVYISAFAPGGDPEAAYQHINEHVQDIRYKLAGKIRHQVRKIPELHFHVDDSAEYANRMERLFQKVKDKRGDKGERTEG